MVRGELSPAVNRESERAFPPESRRKRGRPPKRQIVGNVAPSFSPIRSVVGDSVPGSDTARLQGFRAASSPMMSIMSPITADKDASNNDESSFDQFDNFVLPLRDNISDDDADPVFGPQPDRDHMLRQQAMSSSRIHTEKTSRESIGEFLAHECDCGSDCTAHFSRSQIQILRNATYDKELANEGPDHCLRVLNSMKHSCTITQKQSFEFAVCNRTVCEQVCCLAHGATPSSWRRGKHAAINDLDRVAKKRKSGKNVPYHVEEKRLLGSERAAQTEKWCLDFIQLHGCQMPDSPLVYLDDIPLTDLCMQCAQELDAIIVPLGNRQFRRLWAKNFAKWCRKRARKPFGTCTVCAGYKARLAAAARDKAELQRIKEEFVQHLLMQKIERGIYYKHRAKGMKGEAISIIIDGMDQSKLTLPHYKLKPKDVAGFLETKITGVLVHGKCFDCYVSEPQVKHDSNLNLTCLHNTLMKLLKSYESGTSPRILYLQVDGGSENKNQWMISYLSLLIEAGLFDKIKMCFLPVGHTHEDIDQAFSRIAVHLNKHDALTYDEFVNAIHKSISHESKRPNMITIGQSYNFKVWLEDRLPKIESWTDNLCYRFSKGYNGTTQMHYKFLCNSPNYFTASINTVVSSFKDLAREARADPTVAEHACGIQMPMGIPETTPPLAEGIDFAQDASDKNNTEDQNPTSERWPPSVIVEDTKICRVCAGTAGRSQKRRKFLKLSLKASRRFFKMKKRTNFTRVRGQHPWRTWRNATALLKSYHGCRCLTGPQPRHPLQHPLCQGVLRSKMWNNRSGKLFRRLCMQTGQRRTKTGPTR